MSIPCRPSYHSPQLNGAKGAEDHAGPVPVGILQGTEESGELTHPAPEMFRRRGVVALLLGPIPLGLAIVDR